MKPCAMTVRDSLGNRASRVGSIDAAAISLDEAKDKLRTYMTVVTTSKVLAGAVATGVGGATHLVHIVEV